MPGVFTLVKASFVDLGCLCIVSVLLSLWLFVLLETAVCVTEVSKFVSALPVNLQREVKGTLKPEYAGGVIQLKSMPHFSVG